MLSDKNKNRVEEIKWKKGALYSIITIITNRKKSGYLKKDFNGRILNQYESIKRESNSSLNSVLVSFWVGVLFCYTQWAGLDFFIEQKQSGGNKIN